MALFSCTAFIIYEFLFFSLTEILECHASHYQEQTWKRGKKIKTAVTFEDDFSALESRIYQRLVLAAFAPFKE